MEWKKGPRPAVAAPTSPVKFDHFSLPVALDMSSPVSALQRPWAWLEQEEQEHLLQGNCFNPPRGPEYAGAEFREGFHLHAISHSERAGAFWLLDLGCDSCLAL